MGIDDLIVAGSYGFDIWSPAGGEVQRVEGEEFGGLLEEEVEARLREELGSIDGALVEPKKSSVAAHYRLVSERPAAGGKTGRRGDPQPDTPAS